MLKTNVIYMIILINRLLTFECLSIIYILYEHDNFWRQKKRYNKLNKDWILKTSIEHRLEFYLSCLLYTIGFFELVIMGSIGLESQCVYFNIEIQILLACK